ncbi:hypothetical protein SAMN05421852_105154 [Thermoflavimicrobium dichotomicum]|uniref:Uncharacterized protein n=1 Tax=Thermoflavimicrobium dichotomicum TaxID=46223 RepID=A0A1I3PBR8_9BACL|nr:hypothetical protein SAMN05421852_105154 [Thermoflavimicrobium dichotomicum]
MSKSHKVSEYAGFFYCSIYGTSFDRVLTTIENIQNFIGKGSNEDQIQI